MTSNAELNAMILWAQHLSRIADTTGTPEAHWQAMDAHYAVSILAFEQGKDYIHEQHNDERYRHLEAAGVMKTRPMESCVQTDHLHPSDEFLAENGFTTGFWPPEFVQ